MGKSAKRTFSRKRCFSLFVWRGFRRCRCTRQLSLGKLNCLWQGKMIESKVFNIDGYNWKLVLDRIPDDCHSHKLVYVRLLSCNDKPICADVHLSAMVYPGIMWTPVPERKQVSASPFGYICQHKFLRNSLMNSEDGALHGAKVIIAASLKNIREATDDEQRKLNIDMTMISLEIIDYKSIRALLGSRKAFGIVSSMTEQHCDIRSCSLTRFWAERSPLHRYWLCERRDHGRVIIKRCLNESAMGENFGEILNETNEGGSTITLFKEPRSCSKPIPPINDDFVIVFAKLYETHFSEDLSFLGHIYVSKTTPFREVPVKILRDLTDDLSGVQYDAYLERGAGYISCITSEELSLKNLDVHSGAVVIIRKRNSDEEVQTEDFQNALRQMHEDDLEDEESRTERPTSPDEDSFKVTKNPFFILNSSKQEEEEESFHEINAPHTC